MQMRGGEHLSKKTEARPSKGLEASVDQVLLTMNRRIAVCRRCEPIHRAHVLTSDAIVAVIIATAQGAKRNGGGAEV